MNPVYFGLTGSICIAESYVEAYNLEFRVSLYHKNRVCTFALQLSKVRAAVEAMAASLKPTGDHATALKKNCSFR